MAIRFIPTPKEKVPPKKKIWFFIGFSFLLVSLLFFSFLYYENHKLNQNIKDLEEKISKGKTPEESALEKKIELYKKKIDDFSVLLGNHLFPSQFFEFLEKNTHPRVFFSSISFDVPTRKVNLTGQTDSFQILQRQLSAFKNSSSIEDVSLSNIHFLSEKKGSRKVGFDFSLIVRRNLLEK